MSGEKKVINITFNSRLHDVTSVERYVGQITISFIRWWYGFLGSRAPEEQRGYRQLNLTALFLGKLPKRLTSTKCTFYFASNWQLPYLNQW